MTKNQIELVKKEISTLEASQAKNSNLSKLDNEIN